MIKGWKELASWSKSLQTDDEALAIGFSTTFYFAGADGLGQRTAVTEIFDAYVELVGRENLTWFSLGPENLLLRRTRKLQSWDISPYLLSAKWNDASAADRAWSLTFHGGDQEAKASPFLFESYGEAPNIVRVHGGLSFLKVSFPIDFFSGREEIYYGFLMDAIRCITPRYAYASPSLVTSVDQSYVQRASDEVARLAFRYPSLDIDFPYWHIAALEEGIKGPAWLVYLGPELSSRADVACLREAISKYAVHVEGMESGLLIRVGDSPSMIDRNRDERWPEMEIIAHCLRPLFVRNHRPLLPRGAFADPDRVMDWIYRFNARSS